MIVSSPVVGVDSLTQPLRVATAATTARADRPIFKARLVGLFNFSFSFVLDSYSSRLFRPEWTYFKNRR